MFTETFACVVTIGESCRYSNKASHLDTQLQHLQSAHMWNSQGHCDCNSWGSPRSHCTVHIPWELGHVLDQRRHSGKHCLQMSDKNNFKWKIRVMYVYTTYQLDSILIACRLLKHLHCPIHHHTQCPRHCWCRPPPSPLLQRGTHCEVVLLYPCKMH